MLQEIHHPHKQLFNHHISNGSMDDHKNKLTIINKQTLQQTHFEPSELHQSQSHAMTCALAAASVKQARLLLEEAEATSSTDTFCVFSTKLAKDCILCIWNAN